MDRTASLLVLALASALASSSPASLAGGEAAEGAAGCPCRRESAGNEARAPLRPGSAPDALPGIRFSHFSSLAPSEVDGPLPSTHQESRAPISPFRPWEVIQLLALLACAAAVAWLAHRKLEA